MIGQMEENDKISPSRSCKAESTYLSNSIIKNWMKIQVCTLFP